jgi:diketogulonate reductase-like aldo/keto reductase
MIRATLTMNNGLHIPRVGLGTYMMRGSQCREAVTEALRIGYRHIDTAIYYNNYEPIAEAISSYPRASIFLASKIPPELQGYDTTIKSTLDSLSELNTEYLDLMLIHWPGVAGFDPSDIKQVKVRHETWRALEDLCTLGKVKSIGVSNFLEIHLNKLLDVCRVKPAINQFEYHPWSYDDGLVRFCNSHGIIPEAYCSLARSEPGLWSNQELGRLAQKYSATKGQVLLKWGLQKGCIVLPKSSNPQRLQENCMLDFLISDEDMTVLDGFNNKSRLCWDPKKILV